MNISRVNAILSDDNKYDIFYEDRLVWIQGIYNNSNIVKIGFVDTFEEKDVYIDDLFEK